MSDVARLLIDHTNPAGAAILFGPDDPTSVGADAVIGSTYIKNDTGQWYYKTGAATTSWSAFGSSTGVTSVFGRTGAVAAASGDYTWSQVSGGHPTTIAGYGITDLNSLGDARWFLKTGGSISGPIGVIIGSPSPNVLIRVEGSGSSSVDQYGVWSSPIAPATGTSSIVGLYSRPQTTAAAFTVSNSYGLFVNNMIIGAGSAVTTQYGIFVSNMTGAGSNYAIFTNTGSVSFGDVVTIRAGGLVVVSGATVTLPTASIADGALSTNVALKNAAQTFSVLQTFSAGVTISGGALSVTLDAQVFSTKPASSGAANYWAWYDNIGTTRRGYVGFGGGTGAGSALTLNNDTGVVQLAQANSIVGAFGTGGITLNYALAATSATFSGNVTTNGALFVTQPIPLGVGSTTYGYLGIVPAAGSYVNDGALGDIIIRTQVKAIRFSVDSGTTTGMLLDTSANLSVAGSIQGKNLILNGAANTLININSASSASYFQFNYQQAGTDRWHIGIRPSSQDFAWYSVGIATEVLAIGSAGGMTVYGDVVLNTSGKQFKDSFGNGMLPGIVSSSAASGTAADKTVWIQV